MTGGVNKVILSAISAKTPRSGARKTAGRSVTKPF
jgi:hypothetical protein